MSSYLSPSVDHNLYNPVLPQNNIAEIFQLMGAKQQMYNSNLARINSTLSSMNDLSNSVTNENIKNKVNEFNKSANEAIKKYSNLDFSISDNVKAIDNVYTPLLKDQDFITDFSSTSHLNNQMQIGFAKRDSDKKDERDEFSMTNLAYVSNGFNDLRDAKNSKELKLAAGNARQRIYVPYSDYRANLAKATETYKLSIERSKIGGGYITKTTNGESTDYMPLEKYLDTVLSDKDKQQMRIEATVAVDNSVRAGGKDKVTSDYIQHTLESVDKEISQYSIAKDDISSKMSMYPNQNKMSKEQKRDYNVLQEYANSYDKKIGNLNDKKQTISKINTNLGNGTFQYDDVLDMLISDITEENKGMLAHDLASSWASGHIGNDPKSDPTYIANMVDRREYAKMAQDDRFHQDDMINKSLDRKKDYTIAGIQTDENGNPILGSASPTYGTDSTIETDPLSVIQSTMLEGNLSEADMSNYKTEMINAFIRDHNGNLPTKEQERVLGLINREESWAGQEQKEIRKKYLAKKGVSADNARLAQEEMQTALDAYNLENKTKLVINPKTHEIENSKTDATDLFAHTFTKTLFAAPHLLRLAMAYGLPTVGPFAGALTLKQLQIDNLKNSPSNAPIEDFKSKFNKTYKGSFNALSVTNNLNIPATKAGRLVYNNTVAGPLASFYTSNPDGKNVKLGSYNKGEDLSTLKEAYNIANALNGNQSALPNVIIGREKGGTLIQYPELTWEKAYSGIKYEDASEEQKEAFKLITTKGLRIPLSGINYVQPDMHRTQLYSGKSMSYGGYVSTPDGSQNVYINPTGDKYHYISKNSQGGSFKLKLDSDGLYSLVESKETLALGNLNNIDDRIMIDQYNKLSNVGSSNDFREQITKLLKSHKELIHDEGNGLISVPDVIEKQIFSLVK